MPSVRYVTAGSQEGHISYDGRSAHSSAWRGGAAYVQMCLTCGLEPYRSGKNSNCMCVCGLGGRDGGCGAPLRGHGDQHGKCRRCGGGRPEIHSIATTEVKAKRPRESYTAWHKRRASPATRAEVTAAPDVAACAAVAVAAAPTYLTYGHYYSCGSW